jgi:hypothetical protein
MGSVWWFGAVCGASEIRSCSQTFADLRAVCSGWPELPEVASDANTGIAEYVMGLALRAIDSAYRGAA